MLTGPNFAHEIAALLPAAAVLADARRRPARARLMAALRTDTLRLYGSADIIGAALGGAAKNVIAIAAGVVIGAGLGENARAALITRGIVEIARLAAAFGRAGRNRFRPVRPRRSAAHLHRHQQPQLFARPGARQGREASPTFSAAART